MAEVSYAPGIETVKGSLAKPKKKDGHKCGDYLIGTHREAPTTSGVCSRIYVRKENTYDRNTPVGPDEMEARNRFKTVSQAVAARRKDLNHITTDQAAFLEQKNLPGGKKTMTSYLWKICGDAYDAQH